MRIPGVGATQTGAAGLGYASLEEERKARRRASKDATRQLYIQSAGAGLNALSNVGRTVADFQSIAAREREGAADRELAAATERSMDARQRALADLEQSGLDRRQAAGITSEEGMFGTEWANRFKQLGQEQGFRARESGLDRTADTTNLGTRIAAEERMGAASRASSLDELTRTLGSREREGAADRASMKDRQIAEFGQEERMFNLTDEQKDALMAAEQLYGEKMFDKEAALRRGLQDDEQTYGLNVFGQEADLKREMQRGEFGYGREQGALNRGAALESDRRKMEFDERLESARQGLQLDMFNRGEAGEDRRLKSKLDAEANAMNPQQQEVQAKTALIEAEQLVRENPGLDLGSVAQQLVTGKISPELEQLRQRSRVGRTVTSVGEGIGLDRPEDFGRFDAAAMAELSPDEFRRMLVGLSQQPGSESAIEELLKARPRAGKDSFLKRWWTGQMASPQNLEYLPNIQKKQPADAEVDAAIELLLKGQRPQPFRRETLEFYGNR